MFRYYSLKYLYSCAYKWYGKYTQLDPITHIILQSKYRYFDCELNEFDIHSRNIMRNLQNKKYMYNKIESRILEYWDKYLLDILQYTYFYRLPKIGCFRIITRFLKNHSTLNGEIDYGLVSLYKNLFLFANPNYNKTFHKSLLKKIKVKNDFIDISHVKDMEPDEFIDYHHTSIPDLEKLCKLIDDNSTDDKNNSSKISIPIHLIMLYIFFDRDSDRLVHRFFKSIYHIEKDTQKAHNYNIRSENGKKRAMVIQKYHEDNNITSLIKNLMEIYSLSNLSEETVNKYLDKFRNNIKIVVNIDQNKTFWYHINQQFKYDIPICKNNEGLFMKHNIAILSENYKNDDKIISFVKNIINDNDVTKYYRISEKYLYYPFRHLEKHLDHIDYIELSDNRTLINDSELCLLMRMNYWGEIKKIPIILNKKIFYKHLNELFPCPYDFSGMFSIRYVRRASWYNEFDKFYSFNKLLTYELIKKMFYDKSLDVKCENLYSCIFNIISEDKTKNHMNNFSAYLQDFIETCILNISGIVSKLEKKPFQISINKYNFPDRFIYGMDKIRNELRNIKILEFNPFTGLNINTTYDSNLDFSIQFKIFDLIYTYIEKNKSKFSNMDFNYKTHIYEICDHIMQDNSYRFDKMQYNLSGITDNKPFYLFNYKENLKMCIDRSNRHIAQNMINAIPFLTHNMGIRQLRKKMRLDKFTYVTLKNGKNIFDKYFSN